MPSVNYLCIASIPRKRVVNMAPEGTGYVRTTDLPDDCDEDDEPEA